MEDDLDFLRFFYDQAGDAFGPADEDVYQCINENYKLHTGKSVPADYAREW